MKQLFDLVTLDNIDVLAEDIKNWLMIVAKFKESTKGIDCDYIMADQGFTWVDDGKNDLKVKVKIEE